jgi:pSer/pThr/pTyr-binding forkhead associated (FHA) protein
VDWLDLVIMALRIVLVAILYLFLLQVMRVATMGLRPPRTTLRLVVVDAAGSSFTPGQIIEVGDGHVLGRAEYAHVSIPDVAVSSEHARLTRVGDAWLVADLGSTNGTRVNDSLVNGNTPLAAGDILALGHVRLKVLPR